jgi:hypothetical protein
MRRQVAGLLLVALLSSCDGEQPCSTSAECASAEVCLPATPVGAMGSSGTKYCGRLDDRCETGLRWSDGAGQGLAGSCVVFADPDAGRDAARGDAADALDARDAPADLGNNCGPDGAECAPTTDPCKLPGRCAAGVCAPITNAPDGTKCGNASNACHTDRLCKAGQCQAEGTRPDGHNYDSGNYLARCCGGTPTSINTPNNCGACGLKCASGRCINPDATNNQQWWCSCVANSECWSGCCANGSPPVCSPSTCGSPARCTACPGGASCTASQTPHYWCHY